MRRWTRAMLIAGLTAALAGAAWAQRPYGLIEGRVLNQSRQPLKDAAVLLYGTSLLGSRIYLTTETGAYHFLDLMPGTYTLRVELPGYKTQVWRDIRLILGQTIDWDAILEATTGGETAAEEEVPVTRRSPMIDVRSPALRTVYDSVLLTSLPANRDLYDYQNSIPAAVTADQEFLRTSSILGGTVRGQVYKTDGSVLNDPVDFSLITNLNVDVLETIEFEQAGHPAEAGMAGSTILDIITKTGGRRATLGLTAYVGGTDLDKTLISQDEISRLGMSPLDKYSSYGDFSLSLGGSILEDTLWVFINARRLAWNRKNPYKPEARLAALDIASDHYDLAYRDWLFFGRFTLQYNKNLRYSGSVSYTNIYEPVDFASATPEAAFDYTTILDHDGVFFTTHEIDYLINPTTFVLARGSYTNRSLPTHTRDSSAYSVYDLSQDVYFGSAPFNNDQKRSRIAGLASITHFLDGVLGTAHELKAGFEFEQSNGVQDWNKTNPFTTYWYDYAAGDPYYYSPLEQQGRLSISPCPPVSDLWLPRNDMRRFGGYVQDSLKAGRLALNIGLHLDYSYLFQPAVERPEIVPSVGPEFMNPDVSTTDFLKALAVQTADEGLVFPLVNAVTSTRTVASFLTFSPRAGLVLDLFGTNRTAFKVSAGRYYEPFWIGLYDYDQVFAPSTIDWRWNDLNGNRLMDLPGVDSYVLVHYPNQDPNESIYASDLKAPYTDELLVGLEHELLPDFKVGLSFVYRVDKNILDTFDANNGYDPDARDEIGPIWLPFTFTDPGFDGQFGTGDDQSLTVYGLRKDRPAPHLVIGNIPEAARKYKAAVLTFDKRLSHGWELKSSLVYSSYQGNIGAGYAATDEKNVAFNNPNTLVNGYGPLFFDRPLQFRLLGTVLLPGDWVISAFFQAYSGIPWNRTIGRVYFPLDFGAEYGGVQSPYAAVNAEAPGSHRYRAYVNLDFHLEKALSLGGGLKFTVMADVFNLLGRNGETLYSDPDGILHYDTDPVTYEPAANYGQVASVYGVRAVRLGVRIGL
jgi:hypothetical protein